MTYMRTRPPTARIRSTAQLEKAMQARDVNGRELARLAKVNREVISRLRRGFSQGTARETARAIENALRVSPGTVFTYSDDNDREAV